MSSRKVKKTFSFSGSSPLTPARRIYDELELGDSLSQSPAAKRAKRSGRGIEKTPYHPTMAAVLDEAGSESDKSQAENDSSLGSLSDSYAIRLAEVAGTKRKKRLAKRNDLTRQDGAATSQGPTNEPSIFNPIKIKPEMEDTSAEFGMTTNPGADGIPAHSKTDVSPIKHKTDGNASSRKSVRFFTGGEARNDDSNMMAVDNHGSFVANSIDNRIPSPPIVSDHESAALPSGTRTLKSINKRLKSLDAKLSTAPAENPVLNDEVAAIRHLQEDVFSLSQRIHRDEIRAQVRHQIMFNGLKTLFVAVNKLAEDVKSADAMEDEAREKGHGERKPNEGEGKAHGEVKPKNTMSTKTLEHCLGKYMEDLGRASTGDEVNKVGKLCVQYAGDLFKTL
ncbi:hypothetical protein QBC42DRAFT_296735 [Cladorrhinum samala]|uniref:Uncharacterized protein n=1 Tax=Cladorrhinum samala TaxID=585594 RepID=A0AAV9HSK8_9PEZI|nr:hypothetical protein QBC42DRAFT_296735 [Cladorrhinum samala]